MLLNKLKSEQNSTETSINMTSFNIFYFFLNSNNWQVDEIFFFF